MKILYSSLLYTTLTQKQQWLTRAMAVFCMIAFSIAANAANYIASGNGNWNNAATWGGAGVPGAGDNAEVGGAITVTVTADAQCASLTFTNTNKSTTVIINSGVTLTVSGNVNFGEANGNFINIIGVNGNLNIGGNLAFLNVTGFTSGRGHQLAINNTGIVTVSGNITVDALGNSPEFLFTGNGYLKIGGTSLTNATSTFTAGTGTVEYNGAAAQTIGDFTYNNLTVNNGQTNTLAGATTVNGVLSLTSGKINLGTATTLTIGAAGSVTGANSSKYIITGNSAAAAFIKNGVNSFTTLPIGTANYYLPIQVPASGSVNYTAFIYEGVTANGTPAGTPLVNKTELVDIVYNLATSAPTSQQIQLNWVDPKEGFYFAGFSDGEIGISTYSGGWGVSQTSGFANNSSNFVQSLPVSLSITNTPMAIGRLNTILPITLTNFGAITKGKTVQVDWKANSTSINAAFDVERSATGNSFTKLGTISAKGIGDFNYQFVDDAPEAGGNFYRLKITNEAGKVSYSKTVAVNMNAKTFSLTNVYPTIATNNITLAIGSSITRKAQVTVIDVNGRIVANNAITINSGNLTYPVNVSTLSAGSYVLLLNSGDEQLQTKFIKR